MAITEKSIKLLWAAAGGRCAFPNCWERLCIHGAQNVAPYTLGEMAHICGEKPGANRHNSSQSKIDRDDYKNLILLCPTHHALVDRKENAALYNEEVLLEMKTAHELRVLERLEPDPLRDRKNIAREIVALIEENRHSWMQYGPTSEVARKEPHSDTLHAIWMSERLSIIVPNNRKIVRIINENRSAFAANEQDVVSAFLIHARSYEKWVEDMVPYSAVKRFPLEFDSLMRGIANAST